MRIHVGNLSYQATEDDLRQAFSAHGQVTAVDVIKDKFSDQPKGFAFVEMPVKAEADAAIKALDGATIRGRKVSVAEARARQGGGGGGRERY